MNDVVSIYYQFRYVRYLSDICRYIWYLLISFRYRTYLKFRFVYQSSFASKMFDFADMSRYRYPIAIISIRLATPSDIRFTYRRTHEHEKIEASYTKSPFGATRGGGLLLGIILMWYTIYVTNSVDFHDTWSCCLELWCGVGVHEIYVTNSVNFLNLSWMARGASRTCRARFI